jgi:hypothetical protein
LEGEKQLKIVLLEFGAILAYGSVSYANEATAIFTPQLNTKYTIYQNKNVTYINGTNCNTCTYTKFTSPSTLALFGFKTYTAGTNNLANSIDSRMSKLKLYSCKIWDNGTLIREYVPIKDSLDTPALLDKVNRKIYYNQGTGSFSVGNN